MHLWGITLQTHIFMCINEPTYAQALAEIDIDSAQSVNSAAPLFSVYTLTTALPSLLVSFASSPAKQLVCILCMLYNHLECQRNGLNSPPLCSHSFICCVKSRAKYMPVSTRGCLWWGVLLLTAAGSQLCCKAFFYEYTAS